MDADGAFGRRGGPVWPPAGAAARAPTWGRPDGGFAIRAKYPMPSGGTCAEEGADAAEMGAAFRHQGAGGGGIGAMLQARTGAAGAAFDGARACAQAAMQAAAAVAHGRLPAAAAGAGAGAAAGRGQEIAGTGAVPQPAAAGRRQAGGRGERRKGAKEPMPSGGGSDGGSGHRGLRGGIFIVGVREMFYHFWR